MAMPTIVAHPGDRSAPPSPPRDVPTARHAWSVAIPLVIDVEGIFTHFYGTAPVAVWLDSARSDYGLGRYSILGAPTQPADDRLSYSAADRCVRRGGTDGEVLARDVDVWTWLGDRMSAEEPAEPLEGLPFCGGYVGYLGYGTKSIGDDSRADPSGRDAELVHLSRFLLVDHRLGVLHVVAGGTVREEDAGRAWIAHRVAELDELATVGRAAGRVTESRRDSSSASAEPVPRGGDVRASVDADRYLGDLGRVRERLVAGDSYQACYTYRLRFETREPALDTYRRLRRTNPAPYAAFLRFTDRAVLSSSPERYLRVDPSGRAETRPIKGTARRSDDAETDARIARALGEDPKTRAENLMIVDLLRNDLGSVCVPGTVTVPRFMAVETYATVHQLVTEVQGVLPAGAGAATRAAAALFPGGSMTGAPKRRSVEILDALESGPRGVYSGVIGYLSWCGGADLSVVIRTAVVDGVDGEQGVVSVGTGGAITLDSDPVAELEETIAKTGAVLAAFGRVHPFPVDGRGRLITDGSSPASSAARPAPSGPAA